MRNFQITFTRPNTAELLETKYKTPTETQVVVRTEFSTISCGTERANILGDPNVSAASEETVSFPRVSGYSSSGTVVEVGSRVKDICVGDRVAVYWGSHSSYNTLERERVVKLPDGMPMDQAALAFIATFPLAAIRKTRMEIGESAIVMGLGILGQLAVRLLKAAGAVPVIAVDYSYSRRQDALKGGADYALDPSQESFVDRVKELTGGGVNVAIEVTGVGDGFNTVLDCMAKFGRVALLGCTRDKNFTVDYYRKIHFPGITVVGAHTAARPEVESHPGFFTHTDDIKAVLKLCTGGRINLADLIKESHSPADCAKVYYRLISDRDFPTTVQFDWGLL